MLVQLPFIKLKTHALLSITLFLIMGILWNTTHNTIFLPLAIIAASVIIIMVVKKRRQRRLMSVLYFGCAFFAGISLHQHQLTKHSVFQLNACKSALTIKGSITVIEKIKQSFMNCVITIDVTMMKKNIENETWQTIA